MNISDCTVYTVDLGPVRKHYWGCRLLGGIQLLTFIGGRFCQSSDGGGGRFHQILIIKKLKWLI